jgi:sec-independent protein translocase protein TatB
MFGLGLIEIFFVGVLALVIVGPKDLPQLLKFFGQAYRRVRRFYGEASQGLVRLEQEVDRATAQPGSEPPNFYALLPPEVRSLMEFNEPLRDAQEYQRRQAVFDEAMAEVKSKYEAERQQGKPVVEHVVDTGASVEPDTRLQPPLAEMERQA